MGGVTINPMPVTPYRPEQQDSAGEFLRTKTLLGQQQLQQGQQQLQQQAVQEGQLKIAQTKALNDGYSNALTKDADGNPTFDRQKVIQSVANAGQGSLIPGLNKSFLDLDEQAGKVQESKDKHNSAAQEYFATGAKMIQSANYDPTVAGSFLAHAAANGYAKEAAQFQQQLASDPTKIKPVVDSILSSSPKQAETAKNQAQALSDTTTAKVNQNKLDIIQQYKNNPSLLTDQVNAAAPSKQYPALNARTTFAVQQAMRTGDVEGAKAAIAKASEEVGGIEKETNPAVQAAKFHLATAEKSAEQAIADGDPKAAAQLLVNGTVAPSQLISSRKPAFAQQAFTAAAQMQPGWSATKADADYKVASSPAQVAFFGSAKSLTDKGGTLDQLADAAKDIPAHDFKPFNTITDAYKVATGSGPMAKYASIALGVADDYSKVMGGGQGSDTSRAQALNIIGAKLIPEERKGAIEGIRGSVGSQTNSRIGNNPVLRKMYGGDLPTGQSGSAAPPSAGGYWDQFPVHK